MLLVFGSVFVLNFLFLLTVGRLATTQVEDIMVVVCINVLTVKINSLKKYLRVSNPIFIL